MRLTTLCHIEKDGCWLMMHRVRKKNDLNQDKWVGIGGKFEQDETPEQCLLREVREETGLILTSYRFRGIVTFVSDQWETEYMHLFTADGFVREDDGRALNAQGLPECDEGELVWVPVCEADRLPIWEGDKIFFKLLQEDNCRFFSLLVRYEGEKLKETRLTRY